MVEELSVREAAGIFETADSFKSAIEDLLSSGFDHAEISLLGSQSAVEEKLGYRYETTSELVDKEGVPRISRMPESAVGNAQGLLIGGLVYVGALAVAGPILTAGGSLAVAIGGALVAGGAGGAVGGFLGKLVGDKHSQLIDEQLARGGLILWVSLRDEMHEKRAVAILRDHGATSVDVHSLVVKPAEPGKSILP
jgi:hypothetical protein